MAGERVASLTVVSDGIAHDRRYAFVSSGAPAGKPRLTSRERAAMLRYRASVSANGTEILAPDGLRFSIDDPALLAHLEKNLPQGNRLAPEHDPGAPPYTDVRPIAIASAQTFATFGSSLGRDVDPRRFRANLVLDFTPDAAAELTEGVPDRFPEDALAGLSIQIGQSCRLRLLERIPRCRVVTLDPDNGEPDPALMKHLDRRFQGRLGIYAAVVAPGDIAVGDAVGLAMLAR